MSSELCQSNLATPIGSLPGELLCKILLHAASSHQDGPETAKAWKRRVDFTRVCRAWRNQVLHYSPFWAGVPLHPRCRELDKMLHRWGDHPRSVCANVGRVSWTHTRKLDLEVGLFNAERLGELRLVGYDCVDDNSQSHSDESKKITHTELVNRVASFLRGSRFPVLRSFHISFDDEFFWPAKGPGLPLKTMTRALQHLILQNCHIDWCQGIANLLTLHLIDVAPPPPNTVLSAMLSSSPRLSSLHLDLSNLPVDFTPPSDWSAPYLQDITLAGPRTPCGRILLKILSMDPTTDVNSFRTHLASENNPHVGPVVADSELTSHWTNWLTQFEICGRGKLQIRINETRAGLDISGRPCPTTLTEHEQRRMNATPLFQLFLQPDLSRSFMRNTQLPPYVTSLSVATRDYISCLEPQPPWQDFLRRHANITTLQLFHHKSREILEFLDITYPNNLSRKTPVGGGAEENITTSLDAVVQLPNLRNLFFTFTHFKQWAQNPSDDQIAALSDLFLVLQNRDKASAARLALLRFTDSGVHCFEAQILQKALVEWGGTTIDCRSDKHIRGCDCKSRGG